MFDDAFHLINRFCFAEIFTMADGMNPEVLIEDTNCRSKIPVRCCEHALPAVSKYRVIVPFVAKDTSMWVTDYSPLNIRNSAATRSITGVQSPKEC